MWSYQNTADVHQSVLRVITVMICVLYPGSYWIISDFCFIISLSPIYFCCSFWLLWSFFIFFLSHTFIGIWVYSDINYFINLVLRLLCIKKYNPSYVYILYIFLSCVIYIIYTYITYLVMINILIIYLLSHVFTSLRGFIINKMLITLHTCSLWFAYYAIHIISVMTVSPGRDADIVGATIFYGGWWR